MRHGAARRRGALLSAGTGLALIASTPSPAVACGASGGGSTGVAACSIAEHEEQLRDKWRLGAAYAFTSTRILFDDDRDVDQTRHLALAALAYRPTRAWTLELAVGSLLDGALEGEGDRFDFGPGIGASLGASFRALDARGPRPFLLFTSQLSYADAPTENVATQEATRYRAFDLRLGAVAGWVLWRTLSPYAVVRGFGGPVFWSRDGTDVVGTDANKFQIGGGLSLLVEDTVDLFVEGIPLGERGAVAGAGVAF